MCKKFLFANSVLPKFSLIQPHHAKEIIHKALINCYNTVEQIASQTHSIVSWDILYYPLMIAENALQRVWSPVAHLNSVQHSNLELRKVYENSVIKISKYRNWVNQHCGLYKSFQSFYKSSDYQKCSPIQKKAVNNILYNFKFSGVLLSVKKKKRFNYIMNKLLKLNVNYVNNVFEATLGWNKFITDKKVLSGVPDYLLEIAHLKATECGKNGWLFTLQYPSYSAIMLYCDTVELREEMYWAFNTRASDQGPNAGKWDNTIIMDEILSLRYESARILGFNNYLEKSLVTKMVRNSKQIFDFFTDLYTHTYNSGIKEFLEIQIFAKKYGSCSCLKPWDIAYYREKRKQHLFSITDEELRVYFPEDKVLDGMFTVVNHIYGITIQQRLHIDTWHPDVRFFDIYDQKNEWRGGFYLDIYCRKDKYEGAWMDEFVSLMYQHDDFHQKPIAYLVCNFELLKNKNRLYLLTHNDVIVLFHEFGHVLHHVMTRIDIPVISGINGIAQDAIELPSQIMEKFCWEYDVLPLISMHYATKKSLSKNTIYNLLQMRTYQASSCLLKQVMYGLFDLQLHCEFCPGKSGQVLDIFHKVMRKISIYPTICWDRFPHTFIHIFSDDNYAAGYYSYLWAEMLALNVWRKFQKLGVLNMKIGKLFLTKVLELEASVDLLGCLMNFCEDKITMEPMYQYYGISIMNKKFFSL